MKKISIVIEITTPDMGPFKESIFRIIEQSDKIPQTAVNVKTHFFDDEME